MTAFFGLFHAAGRKSRKVAFLLEIVNCRESGCNPLRDFSNVYRTLDKNEQIRSTHGTSFDNFLVIIITVHTKKSSTVVGRNVFAVGNLEPIVWLELDLYKEKVYLHKDLDDVCPFSSSFQVLPTRKHLSVPRANGRSVWSIDIDFLRENCGKGKN